MSKRLQSLLGDSSGFNKCVSDLLFCGPRALNDVSGAFKTVRGILRPNSVADVIRIVSSARRFKQIRLYSFSCGKNWGFGSMLPPEENAYAIDLSNLAKVRNLDLIGSRVEVEAGVTQGMLDVALEREGRTHCFNTTGAGKSVSLIGNALERGIGYFGSRHDDLLDLEVVLADGSIIRTSKFDSVQCGRYPGGVGPEIRGLCNCSNATTHQKAGSNGSCDWTAQARSKNWRAC
jgi:4-cresol dehydrogenase (hydroxylating)